MVMSRTLHSMSDPLCRAGRGCGKDREHGRRGNDRDERPDQTSRLNLELHTDDLLTGGHLRLGCRRGSGVGTTPSCWSNPRASLISQTSTNLPPWYLAMVIPVTVTCLPVGGTPISGPLWVPVTLQRVTPLSPSAI